MRDYENAAKALRCCRLTSERGCAECPFGLNNNEKCANLLPDAADAIEELLAGKAKLENSGKLLVAAFDRLKEKVPQWISVEERLPEFHMNDSGCVCTRNIVFRTEYKTVHLGYVIRTAHNIETVDGFEQILMDRWYDQTGDTIEGVTHWMPLPEPPKEVQDG